MRRRDLMKATLAAASGMVLRDTAASEPAPDPLRVALLGVGTQGRELIRSSLLGREVRFTAVCDMWEYARRYGEYYLKNYGHQVQTYANYEELLQKEHDLDAVLIASPDAVHAEQVIACLKAGLHVYCETPMSHSLDGARAMVRAMRETGKLLQIGYQRRSNPRYQHVHDKLLLEAKLTGQTTHANTSWALALAPDRGWPRRQDVPENVLKQHAYENMQQFRNWRWYRQHTAGLFANLGAHQVDVLCWFLHARPRCVVASGGAPPAESSRWHENVMALFEFAAAGGVVQAFCQVLTSTRGEGSGSYEHLLGREGSIRISQNPKGTAVSRDPDAPAWDEWVQKGYLTEGEKERLRRSEREQSEVSETGEVVPYEIPLQLDKPPSYPHLANFFAAVRGRAKLTCPADVALVTEVAVHKAGEALTSERKVELGPADYADA